MTNTVDRWVMEGRRVVGGSLLGGGLQDQISGEVGWQQITYTYDPSGRRIAKLVSPPGGGDVDGVVTRYVYDGDQCIAEYDANDVLLRKYIHGPSIDEPICMVEATGGYAGTYYYHFDALGSVVALSDADGDTAQVYEYDVYGQVAASDPNHPNRFMFTGREFDKETGLYYYRARYYNPTIGRFLQTDPVGYGAGMNLYGYCSNNPIGLCDPSGCDPMDPNDVDYWKKQWAWQSKDADGNVSRRTETFATADAFWSYLSWFGGGHIMPYEFLMENLFGTDSINNWDSSREVTFEEVYYRGAKVIRVNGINLIDDSLLDSILQADDALSNSFHEANTTTSGSTGQGLMEWLYSFKTGFASDKREWLFYGGTEFVPIYEISPQFPGIPAVVGYEKQYVGGIYEGTEINYIIQGHAAARIGIPYAAVAAGVLAHNQIRPPDPGETVPLVPTDKLFWLRKGYTEYGKRRNW